jgi:phage repressor protein C with HTH and peptisase S24 domain
MDNKFSNIKERILYIIEYHNDTKEDFFKKIGMTYGNFKGSAKKTPINSDAIVNILSIYKDINPEWLLTGKGEMLKKEYDIQMIHNPPYHEPLSDEEINLYDIDAAANLQTIFSNSQQNIIGKIKIPNLPRCDGAIYIRGDSMYPLLKSGDIIIFREVHNFDNITFGEMYLIDFSMDGDDYLVVKYINRSEKEGYIKLVSYNPHFDPMDIPISSIRAIALVKASIRLNTMI